MSRPEPVRVSLGQVRQRIYEAARQTNPGAWEGFQQGAATGRIFHRVVRALLDESGKGHWRHALSEGELSDPGLLIEHAYESSFGVELWRNRGAFENTPRQALLLWEGVQDFCRWLCGLLEEARRQGRIRYDAGAESWQGWERLIACEEDLRARFDDANWEAPVLLSGREDLILHLPHQRTWCVVELPCGAGSAEADLTQACLYHQMLAGGHSGEGAESVALIRFGRQRQEQLFPAATLETVRPSLRRMVGEVAGVLPGMRRLVRKEEPRETPAGALWSRRAPAPRELEQARRLVAVLEEFGTPVSLVEPPVVGAAFVRYLVEPSRRVPVLAVLRQAMNIQARLGLSRPPILQMECGRIAVDIQRDDRETIPFRAVLDRLPAPDPREGCAQALVGCGLDGRLRLVDFSRSGSAHILVAGTTGSGKSEWLRMMLASLLATNTPETLRVAAIDPKRNAFPELRGSPFLFDGQSLIHPPEDDAVALLLRLVEEVERRYRLLLTQGANDLREYIRRSGQAVPRVVCVCDEYADLMMSARKGREDLENAITRLGQKARAAGVHLVMATQRPSRQIVQGVIKANLSCRVAMRVMTAVESRIVLDRAGAENLLGDGDLLFQDGGEAVRLQAPLLEESLRRSLFSGAGAAGAG